MKKRQSFRQQVFLIFLLGFILPTLTAATADQPAAGTPLEVQPATPSPDTERTEPASGVRHHFAQELTLLLPAFNKSDEIFSPGFGGSLVYEAYWSKKHAQGQTLPSLATGLVTGLEGSLLIYLPTVHNAEPLFNSALILAGGYVGYQLSFAASDSLTFSPALYAGGKYYLSFHPDQTPAFASNPLLCAGLHLNFVLNYKCILGPGVEYQLYYDGSGRAPGHTIQFSLRTGILF